MKIIKEKDYVLFSSSKGEYHISYEEYARLGEEACIELAEKEIEKKINSGEYTSSTINFKQARLLGFCEYGIKDFCKRLELDINGKYSILELKDRLDIHTFMEYSDESKKLFGNGILRKFGTIEEILTTYKTRRVLNLVIRSGEVTDTILRELAYESAMRVIHIFEKQYPNDNRPRLALEASKNYNKGLISKDELRNAAYAAHAAAHAANAAYAATNAAYAATNAAYAAAYAAYAATYTAADAAGAAGAEQNELEFQINKLIELIKNEI